MINIARRLQQYPLSLHALSVSIVALAALSFFLPARVFGSPLRARISTEISGSQLTQLPGSQHPLALKKFDSGRLPASTRLEGISIYFSRTKSQEAEVQSLMAAQQNPSSPLYHQWLTPEQFASRFGMADADIAKVQSWLERQGFSIDSVNRSKNAIHFSGTAGQVEAAFATEMHNYMVNGVKHFAPSTALSVPSALAGAVEGIRNLDDFRPKSHLISRKMVRGKPAFTSSVSGNVYFAPGDITTIYDVSKMYNAGYTGTGQVITIVGQSAISTADIEAFQSAAGLATNPPQTLLMPGTGSSTVFADGDETESDIDLEWSGAIATGATIQFVYTGSSPNYGAFDAIGYAVDNNIGRIISSSYGDCETDLGTFTLESSFEQAATQGQTVLAAAGDDGSTDCAEDTYLTTAQQEALGVDYPASSPNVTALGGTEVSQASSDYLTAGDGYWEASGSSDEITSALKYIPEQAWNEDSDQNGLSAGGGGASLLFKKPNYQTALTPADGWRDVPDISLNSSPDLPGYLFCTSDATDWNPGQLASCNSGFRDASSGALTVAGGTSFAAPTFAGMLALINQMGGYTTGQGLINPTLYTLAGNSTTYAAAFHDITVGNNDCLAGSSFCANTDGFAAGTGYDQVTGLGTIDLYSLATAWPASTSSLIGTSTTVSASNAAPALNASDTFTITVASDAGNTIPTGTVNITVDTGTPVTKTLTANGTYAYVTSFSTAGAHEVVVAYSGDATHATSTGFVTVNVAGTTSGTGGFALTPSPSTLTVSQGSSGTETITVKPAGGYTGTVLLSFDTSNDNALQNLCYEFSNTDNSGDGEVVITSATAVATQLTLDTNAADCLSTEAAQKHGKIAFRNRHSARASNANGNDGMKTAPAAIAFAGLLLAGFLGRHSRKFRGLACILALAFIGLAVSACGGNGSNTISNPPKGTYTITVTGQDSTSATIPSATTNFTFTIQ